MDTTYKTQVGDIVKDMTELEIAEYNLVMQDIAVRDAAELNAKEAKLAAQEKLAAIGLTIDDLAALGL